MKLFLAALALVSLSSCNTMIGLGRDTKECYYFMKGKVQQGGSGGGGTSYDQGAPVY